MPSGHDRCGTLCARDLFCALAAGVVALALYVATLMPDLGGPEDTPKFQFLGYVLGTAHPPGYPLYVLLSHLFVQLPIGTIAYRANLFSAVMAGVACALAYLIGRQIGATRWPAFCAALGLATGAAFWRSAVFAEVYSLAAVMSALATACLLAWGARGGAGRLLAAVAVSSLGLGNHLTIVGIAPAFVIYVLLRNRRALTARVIGAAAVLLVLGISQYGFIVLRTRQGAPYLGSHATSVSELVDIVTARDFAPQRFAFGPTALLTEQIPGVATVMGQELGVTGALGLTAGLAAAIYLRNAGAALLVGAAIGMLAMVVNLSGDVSGFITPVMGLLWPIAGLGFSAIARMLESPRVLRQGVGTIAAGLSAAMPIANVAVNFNDADHHGYIADSRFIRSLYRQLPDRAAIVAENYWYETRLQYLRLTGEEGPDRGIWPTGYDARAARDAARDGRRVFVFAGAATFFATSGLRFERAALVGSPLDEWVRSLPRGTRIVGASSYTPIPLALSGIDRRDPDGRDAPRAFCAFARTIGQSAVERTSGQTPISLAPVFRGDVRAVSDEAGARIEVAGRTVARIGEGLTVAVFTPAGILSWAFTLPSNRPFRVPFAEALYELKGENPCVDVTTAWTDITRALSSGSWVGTLPVFGSVVIEIALTASRAVRSRPIALYGDAAVRTVGQRRDADGSEVLLTELTRTGEGRPVFRLALDRIPTQARARVRSGGARDAITVCAHSPLPLFAGGSAEADVRPDFESEAYFGAGWSDEERTETGYRRRTGERGTLLLPLQQGSNYRIVFDLAGTHGTHVSIELNDVAVGACELGAPCSISVPSSALQNGTNALTLSTPASSLTFYGARIDRVH
jgi:hypothetical protein